MRIEEDAFRRIIKNGTDANLFFIFGDDSYLKSFYCDSLVKSCVPEEMQAFNLHVYEDDKTPFEEIFETAANYPMMSDKTVLLVRDYNLSSLKKEKLTEFASKLEAVPSTTVMIFYFDTLEVEYGPTWRPSSWNPIIDRFDGIGIVAELNSRTPEKLAAMLVKGAGERGTSISQQDAVYLVDAVGTDMQNLVNEFNKVCSFSQGQPVTRTMIDEVCVRSVSADVFMICDSLFSHNNDIAFAVLGELLRIGVSAQEILGAMNSTFVNMYRIKAALNSNHSFEEVVRIFNMNKGQTAAAKKLIAIVRPMRISSIRQCLVYLNKADIKVKRSNSEDAVVLTELIAMLSEVLSNA